MLVLCIAIFISGRNNHGISPYFKLFSLLILCLTIDCWPLLVGFHHSSTNVPYIVISLCVLCRQIQFNHRMTLIGQLKDDIDSMDAATTFHQCVVLLFGAVTQTMLHCSGRLIPQIVRQLKPHLSDDNFNMLTTCQGSYLCCVSSSVKPWY